MDDSLYIEKIPPSIFDAFLSRGYRRAGNLFYVYSETLIDMDIFNVLPLRIRLFDFKLTKSKKKILSINEDIVCNIQPYHITDEKTELFERHKMKFLSNPPYSIYSYLNDEPEKAPVKTLEFNIYLKNKLIACSYLDIGINSVSAVYAMYDTDYSSRSLGILTSLYEIGYAIKSGKKYYYPGYAFKEKSFYDYKKNYKALEYLDWEKSQWFEFKNES